MAVLLERSSVHVGAVKHKLGLQYLHFMLELLGRDSFFILLI
jgi:hypothetical protein